MCCETQPLVSVLMGVRYRREDLALLERSVRSILAQTYRNIECLICDDGSTPEARALLDQFSQEDKRVKLLRGYPKLDLASKLNVCLANAKGAYIARMDDDDHSQPERLARQMDYLAEHPEVSFVGCCVELERDGCPAGERRLPERPTVQDFLFVQPFIHPTLIFHREVLEQVGGYSEEPRCVGCEDYDLLLRLYEKGYCGANMQEPLFRYTLPTTGSKGRTMALRFNEVKTRFVRFKGLGLLPGSFPYVIKPIAVGLIPAALLERLKAGRR